ncbi:MAG: murein biosynthesis integral membrane protein MurJ, partial [Pseudomonadota bacterium]|nr:murein biosynthesis integral membrane protein MurJ [Pseudomonadota bacterium]
MSDRIFRSTAVVSLMTVLSRITGLVRDMAFAQVIGASVFADAFFVAFRIPNFLRRIFAEGAFSASFVPVYSEKESKGDEDEIRRFLDLLCGRFGLMLLVVTTIGIVFAPLLVRGLAPGFVEDPVKFTATVDALRYTFPYIFCIALVAMAGGILNARGRFAAPALTPVFLNLSLIGAVFLLIPVFANATVALAVGVLIAGLIQLLFQLPFLIMEGRLPRPRFSSRKETSQARNAVRRVFQLMLPAAFGASIAQVNLLVNTLLASFLVTGSVSWLYYADRLMEFPLGVFGVALGTVILPALSKHHASGATRKFSNTLDWALRWGLLISLPAAAALAVLATPLIVVLFHYGAFSTTDVERSAEALVAFSFGLAGYVGVRVLSPGFFARQDTATPVRAGVIALLVNTVLGIVLVFHWGHVGLAAATSVAGIVNAALLYRWLRRDGAFYPEKGWGGFLVRITGATATMVLVLWYGSSNSETWLMAGIGERVMMIGALVFGGTLIYVGM